MKNVSLYVPSVEELWYREKCMSDPDTMSYNAGYNVSYSGYHYDTGCIDFPKSIHKSWNEDKAKNPNFFFAYIKDDDTNEWVGYVNFKKNSETGRATMGIVVESLHHGKGYMRPAVMKLIEKAKEQGVKVLTDTVPENRVNALKVFYDLGFVKANEEYGQKFGETEVIACIELKLV